MGAVFVAGGFVLGFFVGGDSGEGGGVAGLCMRGEGVICAVFGGLCTVMVAVSICKNLWCWWYCLLLRRCRLSACWRRRSGCRTSGWSGLASHSPAGGGGWRGGGVGVGVGRLLLSAPFFSKRWLVGFRKVTSILT